MSFIWIVNILSVFFLCVFFAGIVIPQILLIAFRRRLFDEPDERKIHQCVVPRLGGMAFKPVVFFSFVLLLAVNVSTGHDELLKEIGAEALPLAYAFCAIIMLYLVGIADDLIGVRYRAKFFIQIVCGIMLVAGGVELSDLHGMLFIHSMPSWVSIPLTVFVTVFIINAINLIDGIDGLATGVTMPVMLFFTAVACFWGQLELGIFSAGLFGGLCGFLIYNFHPAKVFMGDTGSLFLGGAVCGLAFALDIPLVLILVGIIYILETLSDILQVGYFKLTHGKRIFRMAPLHHHLELGGWSEVKLFCVFSGVTLLACVLAFLGVMGR